MNPTNSKKAGLQSRKKSKQYFTVLCIIQVLLNIVTYRICTEMLEIYKTAKLLPIGWFFCVVTLINSILILYFSVKANNSSIVFLFVYWYTALILLRYRPLIPMFLFTRLIGPFYVLFYNTWDYVLIPRLVLWGKPLHSILIIGIYAAFCIVSFGFLIRHYRTWKGA